MQASGLIFLRRLIYTGLVSHYHRCIHERRLARSSLCSSTAEVSESLNEINQFLLSSCTQLVINIRINSTLKR